MEDLYTKMLEMCFFMLPKMWKDFDIYTFPYLKSKKHGDAVLKQIKDNKSDYWQMFCVVTAFFQGEEPFKSTGAANED